MLIGFLVIAGAVASAVFYFKRKTFGVAPLAIVPLSQDYLVPSMNERYVWMHYAVVASLTAINVYCTYQDWNGTWTRCFEKLGMVAAIAFPFIWLQNTPIQLAAGAATLLILMAAIIPAVGKAFSWIGGKISSAVKSGYQAFKERNDPPPVPPGAGTNP